MTILGIIVNLLAILVIDHAYDLKRAERLFENIRNCNENKTSPTMNTEILLCILTKDGQIIDHDSIVPREMHKFIMEITSNKQLAESSQNLYDACSSNARYLNYTSKAKMRFIIECSLPIVSNAFTIR